MLDRQSNAIESLRRLFRQDKSNNVTSYFYAYLGHEESLDVVTGGLWSNLSEGEKEAAKAILFEHCSQIALVSARSDEITFRSFYKSLVNARSHRVLVQLAQSLPSKIRVNDGVTSEIAARLNLISMSQLYQGFWDQAVEMYRKLVAESLTLFDIHKDIAVQPIVLCSVPVAVYASKFSGFIEDDEQLGSTKEINDDLAEHFASATRTIASLKEIQDSTNFSVNDVIYAPPGVLVAVASTKYAIEFVNQFADLGEFSTDLLEEPMYIKVGKLRTFMSVAEFHQAFWQLLFNRAKYEGKLVNQWQVYYKEEVLFAEEIVPEMSFGEKVKLHKGSIRSARSLSQLKAVIQSFWEDIEIRNVLISDVKGAFHRLLGGSDQAEEAELRVLLGLPKPEVKTKEATANAEDISTSILISGTKLILNMENKSELRDLAQALSRTTGIDSESLFRSLKSNTGIGAMIRSLSKNSLPVLNTRTYANNDGSFSYLFETQSETVNIKAALSEDGIELNIVVPPSDNSETPAMPIELENPANAAEELLDNTSLVEIEFIANLLQQDTITDSDYEQLKAVFNEVSTMSKKKLPVVVNFISNTLQAENCPWLILNISTPRQFSYERLAKLFIEYVISLPWGEAAFNHFHKDTIKFLSKLPGWSAKTTTAWKDEYSNEDRVQIIRTVSNENNQQFGFVISLTPNNHS